MPGNGLARNARRPLRVTRECSFVPPDLTDSDASGTSDAPETVRVSRTRTGLAATVVPKSNAPDGGAPNVTVPTVPWRWYWPVRTTVFGGSDVGVSVTGRPNSRFAVTPTLAWKSVTAELRIATFSSSTLKSKSAVVDGAGGGPVVG